MTGSPVNDGPAMVSYDGGVTWQREGPLKGPRNYCISDIITNTEAASGMGAVVAALMAMLLLSRLRWPPSGQPVRTAPP